MARIANIAMCAGAAIYTAAALYSLSEDGAPRCPDPSPRSVEALFAPCLAGVERSAAEPAPDPILPDPTIPPPQADEPAVARSGEDVETTGSIGPR